MRMDTLGLSATWLILQQANVVLQWRLLTLSRMVPTLPIPAHLRLLHRKNPPLNVTTITAAPSAVHAAVFTSTAASASAGDAALLTLPSAVMTITAAAQQTIPSVIASGALAGW